MVVEDLADDEPVCPVCSGDAKAVDSSLLVQMQVLWMRVQKEGPRPGALWMKFQQAFVNPESPAENILHSFPQPESRDAQLLDAAG